MLFISTVAVWVFVCISPGKSEILYSPPCELRDAYGYDNIDNAHDFHEWALGNGPSSSGTPTGPSSNRANDGGCYLLHKTTIAHLEEFSLLVSPCYTKLKSPNNQPVLQFFHYTYGRDIGSLQVHLLRHDCLQPSRLDANTMVDLVNEENKIWEVIGSQADSWTRAEINLDVSFPASPFQIIFKAVVGNGTLSDIALDEISINGIECYLDYTFLCDNGSCINENWICDQDGFPDCIDETDEPEPGCCNPFTKFKCISGRCINKGLRCDGDTGDCDVNDIKDNSDETNCTDGHITSNTNTEDSSPSIAYPGEEITEVTPLLDSTEASESEKHPFIFATSIYYTSENPNIFIVNNAETFCQKDSIVSGFNNCSFIGVMVAFGATVIVLAALVTTRIFNRCSRNPKKRKSIANSETKNSLVPDYALSLDNLETGQDNKTADCDTKDEIVKSHKYEVLNDGMTPPTASKVAVNGEPQNSNGISTTSSLQKASNEDAKDIEMDTTDNKTNTEIEPAKEITEQNEVDEVTANQKVDFKKEQSTPVYALPNKTRNTDKLQDHSTRKSTAYDEIDYTDKNHTDGKSSIPVYAKPHRDRDDEEISLQSSNTTNTNQDHSEKTPEPMYAEPDNPELNTRDQVSDDRDAIPGIITPYTETVIAGENEAASPDLNDNIPPYSVSTQVSTSDTDPEGYSQIPKTGLSERDEDADMYEEVNIGGVDSVSETRRPTLPEGHPSLQQLPHGHSVSSSKSSGNRLDAIDEKDNPDPIEFYAESNFKPEVKQTNGNDGDGDQTKWTDNVVYVSADD